MSPNSTRSGYILPSLRMEGMWMLMMLLEHSEAGTWRTRRLSRAKILDDTRVAKPLQRLSGTDNSVRPVKWRLCKPWSEICSQEAADMQCKEQ